jgi:hypothetical protein
VRFENRDSLFWRHAQSANTTVRMSEGKPHAAPRGAASKRMTSGSKTKAASRLVGYVGMLVGSHLMLMPLAFSISMKSDCVALCSPFILTAPTCCSAPPYRRSFSVMVVLPFGWMGGGEGGYGEENDRDYRVNISFIVVGNRLHLPHHYTCVPRCARGRRGNRNEGLSPESGWDMMVRFRRLLISFGGGQRMIRHRGVGG